MNVIQSPFVGSITDDLEYALATRTKWRTGIPQPTVKFVRNFAVFRFIMDILCFKLDDNSFFPIFRMEMYLR